MTTLDIDCLRSLITVASLAGVRRAASALHISQPTVSGHLRRLEGEVGFPIVFRQGRSIAFTARGEDLLQEAYALVLAHDDAVARLSGAHENDLTVASTQHASEPMLQGVADVLRRAYPRREVRFEFHRTARIREFVHERRVAVAIGFGDLGRGVEQVAEIPLAWVGPGARAVDANRLVAFARPCAIRERMTAAGDAVIARECIDLASLLGAVRSGVGITALPSRRLLGAGLRRIRDLPILPPVPLTFVTGPEIDTGTRAEVRRELRAAWAGPTG